MSCCLCSLASADGYDDGYAQLNLLVCSLGVKGERLPLSALRLMAIVLGISRGAGKSCGGDGSFGCMSGVDLAVSGVLSSLLASTGALAGAGAGENTGEIAAPATRRFLVVALGNGDDEGADSSFMASRSFGSEWLDMSIDDEVPSDDDDTLVSLVRSSARREWLETFAAAVTARFGREWLGLGDFFDDDMHSLSFLFLLCTAERVRSFLGLILDFIVLGVLFASSSFLLPLLPLEPSLAELCLLSKRLRAEVFDFGMQNVL